MFTYKRYVPQLVRPPALSLLLFVLQIVGRDELFARPNPEDRAVVAVGHFTLEDTLVSPRHQRPKYWRLLQIFNELREVHSTLLLLRADHREGMHGTGSGSGDKRWMGVG